VRALDAGHQEERLPRLLAVVRGVAHLLDGVLVRDEVGERLLPLLGGRGGSAVRGELGVAVVAGQRVCAAARLLVRQQVLEVAERAELAAVEVAPLRLDRALVRELNAAVGLALSGAPACTRVRVNRRYY